MPDKRNWPDLVGLLQATSDILEKAGIIENDALVIGYESSSIRGISKDNPATYITVAEVVNLDHFAYKTNPRLIKKMKNGAYKDGKYWTWDTRQKE